MIELIVALFFKIMAELIFSNKLDKGTKKVFDDLDNVCDRIRNECYEYYDNQLKELIEDCKKNGRYKE